MTGTASMRSTRLSGLTRRVVTCVVGVALVLAVVPSFASPASAGRRVPRVTMATGGSGDVYVACSASLGYMATTVAIQPDRGYSTQRAGFRLYIYDNRTGGGFWTQWGSVTAPYRGTSTIWVSGQSTQVYAQYRWLRGGTWVTAGEWAPTYVQVLGGWTYPAGYCQT